MQSKLSDLVDNLSEINKKECPKCMERKCDLSDLKIIDYITNAKNVEKDVLSQQTD